MKIKLSLIYQNPFQIRSIDVNDELIELAESINEYGLLQPIKVRQTERGYELIYGHRRVAAMRYLGWTECEAILQDVDEEESLLQSIAENIQREDLDILQEAQSYQTLIGRGYTIKDIAELVNKPQGRISNRLSILRLPEEVQELVRHRKGQHISTTEFGGLSPDSASRIASAIRNPDEAIEVAQKAISEGLNTQDIRNLTSLLKETQETEERLKIISRPWYENSNSVQTEQEKSSVADGPIQQEESIGDLFHRKSIWNLERIGLEKFDHFTIGYSSRSIDQFIEILQLAKINLLVDIRSVPISRYRPEFSKGNLSDAIILAKIDYIHLPGLGIPPEVRKTNEKDDIFRWYDENVDIINELSCLSEELQNKKIAFMCVEIDPQSCHRHRLSKELEVHGFHCYDL